MSSNGNHVRTTCSVVICTNNRPRELERCLSGVAQQTLKPIEVVVVDNAMADERTAEIARKFDARYVQETCKGASCARNRGVAESAGDIIAYLDDDAYPEPQWLSNLLSGFDDDRVMAVGGRTVAPPVDDESRELCALIQGPGSVMEHVVVDKSHPQWFEMTAFGGLGMTGNMGFRRAAFELVNGFDPRLGLPDAAGEEQFAVFNLVDRGYKAAYVPGAVVTHPTSCTVEGLRNRYFAACSYAISYVLFFFVHVPQHRSKLLKFLFEAVRGVKREWRGKSPISAHRIHLSRFKVILARFRGVYLYLRTPSRRSDRPSWSPKQKLVVDGAD
jgi:cellulose synthase/poly-beta-1,6-N-acetylglucosamine synthase-like glycosyltransferase